METPANEPVRQPVDWYDVIVTTMIVFGVALNVYIMVDSSTDGALSRQVVAWWRSHVVEPVERRVAFVRDRERVLGHATWFTMEATEGGTQ